MKRRWGCLLLGLVVGGLVVVGPYAGRSWLLPAAARWLDVGEMPRAADYVMVLGGGENSRPFVAAAIVRAGLAPKVLLPRSEPTSAVLDGLIPPYHEINRQVLLKRGIPENDILLIGRDAGSTFDEARGLAEFLEARDHCRVLVVTSDFHTRRTRWIFRRVLGGRAGQLSFVSAPMDSFNPDNWWQIKEGFLNITSEYLKLAFYAFWYGKLGHWSVGLVLATAAVAAWLYLRRVRAASPPNPPSAPDTAAA
jgi:uncharacterized SAM-binding protein YcdF (DUF218 family)